MNTNYKIVLAFLLGIFIRIITNPWILGFSDVNYSIHKNKLFDALLFGAITGLIQILIDFQTLENHDKFLWILLFATIIISLNHIIHEQIFIKEKDLLLKLKENYAESIRFSDIQMSNKSIDSTLKNFLIEQNNTKKNAIAQINVILSKLQ